MRVTALFVMIWTIVGSALGRQPAREPAPREGPGRAGWWNDRVFYQVFVRSFADDSGDGVGDFRGLAAKLDYLKDMGVSGLWLMPIHPSPSYHGYDVTDFKAVNPQYGTMEDFKALVRECDARGIKIIIDLVMNHTSDRHPWFAEAADAGGATHGWYVWEAKKPEWKGFTSNDVWHRARGGGGFYYALFSRSMPDLNFREQAVTRAMYDVNRFWLKDVGVAGFRLDAIRHLIEDGPVFESTPATHAWLKEYFKYYKGVSPEAFTIGEVWEASKGAASYVGDELDTVFEFDLAEAMVKSARDGVAAPLERAQRLVMGYYPPNQYGRFLSNHDQTRVMTRLGGGQGPMRSAAWLLLTGPGIPFVYYGEEIGMTGDKPDEKLRTPMQWSAGPNAGFSSVAPWQAPNPDVTHINVESQSKDEGSLLALYKKLIRARNDEPALLRGQYAQGSGGHPGVFAFARWSDERPSEVLVLAINLTADPVSAYAISVEKTPLRGAATASGVVGVEGPTAPKVTKSGGLEGYRPAPQIPPHSGVIVRLRARD